MAQVFGDVADRGQPGSSFTAGPSVVAVSMNARFGGASVVGARAVSHWIDHLALRNSNKAFTGLLALIPDTTGDRLPFSTVVDLAG